MINQIKYYSIYKKTKSVITEKSLQEFLGEALGENLLSTTL